MAGHISVLLNETIENLDIKPTGIYVDGTLGWGGHSEALLSKLTSGHLYSFDQDENAIEASQKRLSKYSDKLTIIHDNFSNLEKDLQANGVNEIDGMMMDLGVSSPMFDTPERGFSYNYDGPLDMRMNQEQRLSAYQVVNEFTVRELTNIIRNYGEESFAHSIAISIDKQRKVKPITTTFELVDAIKSGMPEKAKRGKGHPAKKTFQAIRIAVNDELNVLQETLNSALKMLKPNGRLAVISFQSLEDRIVKTTFKEASSIDDSLNKLPIKARDLPKADYELITKKPILASKEELDENHRSHSAKLRVIKRR